MRGAFAGLDDQLMTRLFEWPGGYEIRKCSEMDVKIGQRRVIGRVCGKKSVWQRLVELN